MYTRQSDLNNVLECVESENKSLKAENGVLRASVQKLEQMVTDLRKRLRGAFERFTCVVKAIGMLKYDNEDYKAPLTTKQANLVDAISVYSERQAKKAGFDDLADEMNKRIGISNDIECYLPKERKRSRSHDMDL